MLLYVFDMFHILLSGDSLRDLWNVCMHRLLLCSPVAGWYNSRASIDVKIQAYTHVSQWRLPT